MTQILELRQLKDYEVLGVGALRRESLQSLAGQAVLWLYPQLVPPAQRSVYEAILQETLAWLKPREIRESSLVVLPEEYLLQVMLEELQREFPQTSNYLKGSLKELLTAYLEEFPWQGPLLMAQARYFPVFLRKRLRDPRLYLIAQAEWLECYLTFADFGFPPAENGRMVVNPSLQSLYVPTEVSEVQLTPGLVAFYYDGVRRKVRRYKMDLWDAAVMDLLAEDRKYTREQLTEQLRLAESVESLSAEPLSAEQWQKKLDLLMAEGLLLTQDLQRDFLAGVKL